MKANTQLSIVIPTYNRSDFLDYSLEIHIPLARQHNIEILIFDNASTDKTESIVLKWMKEYPYLSYQKNEINIGPDANFEKALKCPDTDYVWLLGDSTKSEINTFDTVIEESKNIYDLILLNDTARVQGIENCIVNDKNFLLQQFGWHMTQMSSLIFNKEIIAKAFFSRYYETSFIQTGIIFEVLASKNDIYVKWLNNCSVIQLKKDGLIKNSWQAQTFEIWITRWSNFILSLPPQYTLENKLYTIYMHNKITKLFGIRNLLLLRSKNHYNLKIFFKYYKLFPIALKHYSLILLFIIAVIPSFPIRYIIMTLKKTND